MSTRSIRCRNNDDGGAHRTRSDVVDPAAGDYHFGNVQELVGAGPAFTLCPTYIDEYPAPTGYGVDRADIGAYTDTIFRDHNDG